MEQRLRRCESVQTLHFFFLKSSWTVMFVTNSVARPITAITCLVCWCWVPVPALRDWGLLWYTGLAHINCRAQPRWQQLP